MLVCVMLWVEREQWKPKPLDSLQKFQETDVGILNSENTSYVCQLHIKPNPKSLTVEGLIMACKN